MKKESKYRFISDLIGIGMYSTVLVFFVMVLLPEERYNIAFAIVPFIAIGTIIIPKIKYNIKENFLITIIRALIYLILSFPIYYTMFAVFGSIFHLFEIESLLSGGSSLFTYFILFSIIIVILLVYLLSKVAKRYTIAKFIPFMILLYFSMNSWLITFAGLGMMLGEYGEDWSQLMGIFMFGGGLVMSIILSLLTFISFKTAKKIEENEQPN